LGEQKASEFAAGAGSVDLRLFDSNRPLSNLFARQRGFDLFK